MAGIFVELNFLIIKSERLDDAAVQSSIQQLKDNGAENVYTYTPDTNIYMNNMKDWFVENYGRRGIHFIISETTNFPFYSVAAFDFLIPVVKTGWLVQSIKNKRHIKTNLFSPDLRHCLRDAQVFVSPECCRGPAERLFYSEMVQSLGGTYVESITTRTTHVIANDSDDKLVSVVVQKLPASSSMTFVYPTWLIQCFKESKNVSCDEHLIDLNDNSMNQDRITDAWEHVCDMTFEDSGDNFLKNRKFLIGMDISMSSHAYIILQQIIEYYGGEIYHQLNDSDVLNHSDSFDCFLGYTTKSKEYDLLTSSTTNYKINGKNIGNLIWLFNMWSQNEFITSEYKKGKIIFAPFPSKVFNKNSCIMTFTNYFGPQRTYIQRLVNLMGGISTTQLSNKNTHLISQLPMGKKFITAKKWGHCVVVNHLWLETCYKQNSNVDPDQIEFHEYDKIKNDVMLNLGQMTFLEPNNAKIDDESLLQTQEPPEDLRPNKKESENSEESLGSTTKISDENNDTKRQTNGLVSKPTRNDTVTSTNETFFEASDIIDTSLIGKRTLEAATTKQKEKALKYTNAVNLFKEISSDEDEKNDKVSKIAHQNTSSTPDNSNKDHSHNNMAVPSKTLSALGTSRQSSNLSPILQRESSELMSSGGSRRAAAAQAAKRLHSDMESLNEYQKHKKGKNGKVAMLPQEKAMIKERKEMTNKAKDKLERCDYYIEENGKTVRRHIFNIYAVNTGCDLSGLSLLDKTILNIMGITLFSDDYGDNENIVNCIIAPKRLRTSKFLKVLSFPNLRYAVTPDFIFKLLKEVNSELPFDWDQFIDIDNFIVPDISRELLDRVSKTKKLFERAGIFSINLVRDISGGPIVISSILKEHGIQNINILDNNSIKNFEKFEINHKDGSKNGSLRKVKLEDGTSIKPPKYILVASKPAQMKKFRDAIMEADPLHAKEGIFITNWDWCVDSIFNLSIDYKHSKNVLFDSIPRD
ncbi:similar to Saccharomyces cerevisiae YHR154W RTT107 Protein implicated in Mms22-dependent DNA repair during S phase [Maudiozyma saulgeensis]|uniref:Similar to Saccharomyces cerevisiae YHR154W RTT107 Protein implicated in Mms22-dependent DNA repair during S phase n=1 Tax=Maudiozyma saulgeensis TaxID=1789683 RepID=A0A1X7R522_9SACH|nr:similar to Saccharomyces cerevisiae YHR154W RTT107 Protein implicated in Mms22-dependent DNA repair during S phase [Kazachstania saulgeensis]